MLLDPLEPAGHDVFEDERIDQQQKERIDEGPEEAEDGAAVAGLELTGNEAVNQGAIAPQAHQVTEHRPPGRAR